MEVLIRHHILRHFTLLDSAIHFFGNACQFLPLSIFLSFLKLFCSKLLFSWIAKELMVKVYFTLSGL